MTMCTDLIIRATKGPNCNRWLKLHVSVILCLLFGAFFLYQLRYSSIPGVKKIKNSMGRPICGDGILQDYKCLDEYDFSERPFAEKRLIPPAVVNELLKGESIQRMKRIVVIDHKHEMAVGNDIHGFTSKRCLVSQCVFSGDISQASLESADAVFFRQTFHLPKFKRPKDQVWAFFNHESPNLSPDLTAFKDKFNYTASYRTSSSIFVPYFFYRRYKKRRVPKGKQINYAEGKTKKVAWMVSNCALVRNERMKYAKEIGKHIPVDIYGRCGTMNCPRSQTTGCLKPYKFYLAFENANCRDYITEKLFRNSYRNNLLTIVMGAHPDDYKKLAPPHSYIHVDDFASSKDLVNYLNKLDKDDQLYNEYFKWKELGYIDRHENVDFNCRFCALLWSNRPPTWIGDVNAWWRRKGICIGPGKWTSNRSTADPDDQHVYQHVLDD